ncbi:hypothetical protein AA313_de0205608 [Arthrobotrys entomopaga]|nr:hypothetical protein AA313_de0205608 [Arthrobotrys entomopaga]
MYVRAKNSSNAGKYLFRDITDVNGYTFAGFTGDKTSAAIFNFYPATGLLVPRDNDGATLGVLLPLGPTYPSYYVWFLTPSQAQNGDPEAFTCTLSGTDLTCGSSGYPETGWTNSSDVAHPYLSVGQANLWPNWEGEQVFFQAVAAAA